MTHQLAPSLWKALKFRCIGPSRGGRVIAVAGHPTEKATFYFGAVAGGLWKTVDASTTWTNISDGYFKTASVSDIAVSPSDPNVIYVGMGESTIRTDVSYGDGVYKSVDGGKSWRHCGLADTRHIGKVRVHPRNPDRVYVAALGHAFGPNEERGVFRSKDGGASWEKVLFVSDKAGAVDLTFDPRTPDVLYAAVWQVYRNFWELVSGGPESGLWKSVDGGDTWTNISRAKGLPQAEILGKIGVAASPAKEGRVWALIEAKNEHKPGLYRSDDFGESWQLLCDNADLRQRPWYYMHVFADPQDAETVYVLNLSMWKSTDGGKSFAEIPTPHGDNHGLWIDPDDNRRMVQGNDGGACVSFTGGESFSTIYNQLTAQFYRMDTDNRFPYRVYGTQQDNSSVRVPVDTSSGVIAWGDCDIAGTGESGFIAVDPKDEEIIFVGAVGSSPGGQGALQRADMHSGQIRLVNIWPEEYGGDIGPRDLKYRFPWTFPILFSPHDPNVLYACGNLVFRSTNSGHSWEAISPDLTRADVSKLGPSGGAITYDTSGAEHYATIASLRESIYEAGVLWAASDDGLVHISRDGGELWQNVTPTDLPEWAYIQTVELSPHDAATAYLAATRYKLDDTTPYLFKTDDYGQTWTLMVEGIPAHDYTRVVRCDPEVKGLLYAGTETGLYVSFDDGGQWTRWEGNLPVAPIYDLTVKGSDLIVATHGRSFWVMDDLTPLRQASVDSGALRIYPPRPAYRVLSNLYADWMPAEGRVYDIGSSATYIARKDEATGLVERQVLDAGEGSPRGALIFYTLPADLPTGIEIKLEILDKEGTTLIAFSPKPADYDSWDDPKKAMNPGPWIAASAGAHRFRWDLRLAGATKVLGNKTAGEANRGPLVLPGLYQVRLSVGEQSVEESLEVKADPRATVSSADLSAQFEAIGRILTKISDAHKGVNRLREARAGVEFWQKRLADHAEVTAKAGDVLKKLGGVEDQLIQPGDQKNVYSLTNRPRLNSKLSSLIPIISTADAAPTEQAIALISEYSAQIDDQLTALQRIIDEDILELNRLIHAADAMPIAV
ncbi:MAG: glycosyl hydrolase [Caldilineaceae bacterium]|nr:glycosyl hydrolase [Caldilineaceae bacterium]